MRRGAARVGVALVVALGVAGCGDDAEPGQAVTTTVAATSDVSEPTRFCDVYLEYLSDPTDAWLERVVSTGDDTVAAYAEIVRDDPETGRVLAAIEDLDEAARAECQAEWVGGAQGAGDNAAAAQAFLDALVAGDPLGARNVAAANAVAVFDWAPIAEDPAAGTPAVLEVDGQGFSLALDAATLAECQVESGVVIACLVVS